MQVVCNMSRKTNEVQHYALKHEVPMLVWSMAAPYQTSMASSLLDEADALLLDSQASCFTLGGGGHIVITMTHFLDNGLVRIKGFINIYIKPQCIVQYIYECVTISLKSIVTKSTFPLLHKHQYSNSM